MSFLFFLKTSCFSSNFALAALFDEWCKLEEEDLFLCTGLAL